jgi:uncharacterized membrane protein
MDLLATQLDAYNISLWIHISAAVIGLGATAAESILMPVAMKSNPRHVPLVFRVQLVINRYFVHPALLLILVTGIYQAIEYDWDLGAPWISATFVIVLVLGGLTGGYFLPTDKKLLAMSEKEIADAGDGPVEFSEEFKTMGRTEGFFGAITGLLIVIAVFLMVVKPGA